jgi:hypothetical protein
VGYYVVSVKTVHGWKGESTHHMETRYQRIAREQAERQAARAEAEKAKHKRTRARRFDARRERRLAEAFDREAEYAPDSFDPPETPQF